MNKYIIGLVFYSGLITTYAMWERANAKNTLDAYTDSLQGNIESIKQKVSYIEKDNGLDCTPEQIADDLWSCGNVTYRVVNFTENLSKRFLGPHLSATRSLEDVGCRYDYSLADGKGFRCYKEREIKHGRAAGLMAYYSYNLIPIENK